MQKKIKRKTNAKSFLKPLHGLAAKVESVSQAAGRTGKLVFGVGDTVRVFVRIKEGEKERLQAFEGVVTRRGNHGGGRSFTVRKISHGVGVERTFLDNSPKIGRLEVVSPGLVRRAKLYYLRGLEGKKAKIDRDLDTVAGTGSETPATNTSSN